MFSAMILSNVLGSVDWTAHSYLIVHLLLLVLCVTILPLWREVDLLRIAYARLHAKVHRHVPMLALMGVLRLSGLFAVFTTLDELIWIGYAMLVDDAKV